MATEMNEGKMLSFYKKHNVVPVFQNITDIQVHFHRRETLYKQMGIPASNFAGKRILEIGPGTGQNALFLASLKPASLTLVEPNPAGIEKIEAAFAAYTDLRKFVQIEATRIEDFTSAEKYDFVICEGLVGASGHPDPHELIRAIATHVVPGGGLVLTSVDYPAYLSEMLRRLLGHELTRGLESFDERVSLLTEIFEPHLKALPGMTRDSRDWIIDVLINPASVDTLVTFSDLVTCLSELGFDVRGTSPRFIADWTWYKDAALEKDFFNQAALRSYWHNAHCFIDCRSVYVPRDASENQKLAKLCQEIHDGIRCYEETDASAHREAIIDKLGLLITLIEDDMPEVAAAIREVCSWLYLPVLESSRIQQSSNFGSWFGHGQTYVLFDLRQDRIK